MSYRDDSNQADYCQPLPERGRYALPGTNRFVYALRYSRSKASSEASRFSGVCPEATTGKAPVYAGFLFIMLPLVGHLHHFSACNQRVNWYNVGYMQPIKKELADIIYSDEEVLSGTPCFKETRVPVPLILDYLALGWSLSDLKEFYPTVKTEYITKLIQVLSEEFTGHVKTA